MENQVLESLITRRSIRNYSEKEVEDDVLELILQAGTYAASGRGRQSAVMVVVRDPETREILRNMNADIMGTPDMDPFYGAKTIVIVLADASISTHLEDGCLVMGNLMTAAHALGVGSCWIHRARQMFETEEGKALKAKWGLGDNYIGVGNCILGYRDCDYPAPKPRREGRSIYN